jgi:hypothetical protein
MRPVFDFLRLEKVIQRKQLQQWLGRLIFHYPISQSLAAN